MKLNNSLVSIIIRSKNEERWIGSCLRSILNQNFKNYEIILVDNKSTDSTIKIAKNYRVKIINIEKYKPGFSINRGIKVAKGDVIVILSAHCIPKDKNWLSNLIKPLKNKNIAGVYGRQEPLSYSSDYDKRDLINTFGLDKILQKNDPFFHNANSALLKTTWLKFRFNEKVDSLEDRVWGQDVINSGHKIVYEPKASVYHYHGINQNLNPVRLSNVIKTLGGKNLNKKNNIKLNQKKIICIIPVRGKSIKVNNESLIIRAINDAKQSKLINKIFVATDNIETAKIAKKNGADTSFLRPQGMSEDFIGENEVINFVLDKLEKQNLKYEIVVTIKETYPFRNFKIIDKMIKKLIIENNDTIIAIKKEKKSIWKSDSKMSMIGSRQNFMPRKFKTNSTLLSLAGLCYVTKSDIIRNINIFSNKISFYEIKNIIETFEYSEFNNSKASFSKLLSIF